MSDFLPRLLYDPDSGETVLEFRQYEGNCVNTLDRRVIVGLMRADLTDGPMHKKDAGVLRLTNGLFPTAHDYSTLRELLWPQEKVPLY